MAIRELSVEEIKIIAGGNANSGYEGPNRPSSSSGGLNNNTRGGYVDCANGVIGGMVAGSVGGPGVAVAGAIGGGIAGGCFKGNDNDNHSSSSSSSSSCNNGDNGIGGQCNS
ncbi:hypothetical protein [Pantoea stewartii]|uniref:hypothetical protein n=1 Tax=Pantoea stewartii TaxID=66269 RepID=UPI00193951EB|nr:hypothetical protein [Pantoea stewartii]